MSAAGALGSAPEEARAGLEHALIVLNTGRGRSTRCSSASRPGAVFDAARRRHGGHGGDGRGRRDRCKNGSPTHRLPIPGTRRDPERSWIGALQGQGLALDDNRPENRQHSRRVFCIPVSCSYLHPTPTPFSTAICLIPTRRSPDPGICPRSPMRGDAAQVCASGWRSAVCRLPRQDGVARPSPGWVPAASDVWEPGRRCPRVCRRGW
jgi:hypothetical protein